MRVALLDDGVVSELLVLGENGTTDCLLQLAVLLEGFLDGRTIAGEAGGASVARLQHFHLVL
eukprot:CAMPEP_0180630894 /NCGR_PEP_ID=MMETSP1037_2-20121125/40236_1 /TAXON_ID=632150 /ORGANISM="Azadinium spinosum, Strain 3D9" /LENGTH=61 /DNA_ID=CAMNT_0022651789 /DNA_START=111 /DNA_END=296 /DNA_ORIENTATION=+